MRIRVEPLTKKGFAPYGEVIGPGVGGIDINAGTCVRYDDLARAVTDEGGAVALSVFKASPRTLPMELELFERHPQGSQAFLPMGPHPFCVVVTEGDQEPDLVRAKAFVTGPNQGVNIGRGVWHHPLIALRGESLFWVVDRKGEGENLECVDLDGKLSLEDVQG